MIPAVTGLAVTSEKRFGFMRSGKSDGGSSGNVASRGE